MGKSFIITLAIGILFGFGFAYVLLNIGTYGSQQASNFFRPSRFFLLVQDQYFPHSLWNY